MALIPVFIFWVGRQERLGRPAIIPVSNTHYANAIFALIPAELSLAQHRFYGNVSGRILHLVSFVDIGTTE